MLRKSSRDTALTSILHPALSCLPFFPEDIHGESKVEIEAANRGVVEG
jgi:hypothetical protein